MKENKSFFKTVFVVFAVCCLCFLLGIKIQNEKKYNIQKHESVTRTNYGAFLAAQHALYINDFDAVARMINSVDSKSKAVQDIKGVVAFFDGKIPNGAANMDKDKEITKRFIYDAYLVEKGNWKSLYHRHNKETYSLSAPLRIFSAVQQGKTKEALNFVDGLKTNKSWKAFIRGQIAVLNKDVKKAAQEFADVHPDFMNINDYLYLMSFYKANDMTEDMDILRNDFASKPDGMIILSYNDIPDWSEYDGFKNNLAFSIVQTISHTQLMIFTDLSLLMLRFAQLISNETYKDAINYYLGQYYSYNSGDYEKSFNQISDKHPLYLFGQMKIAEKTGNFEQIKKIARQNPFFISAVNRVIANEIKNGNRRAALKLVNRALNHKDINDAGRVWFLKQRANVYLMFNQPDKAQKDLISIQELDDRLPSDVLLLQARVWIQQDRELDNAYDYAMTAIKRNTSDVPAWDVLGVIVEKREGLKAALELIERVGEIAVTTSSLFEHLGDFYVKKGDKEKAKKSYARAIDLSDDGMVIVSDVQKKIRKLK